MLYPKALSHAFPEPLCDLSHADHADSAAQGAVGQVRGLLHGLMRCSARAVRSGEGPERSPPGTIATLVPRTCMPLDAAALLCLGFCGHLWQM